MFPRQHPHRPLLNALLLSRPTALSLYLLHALPPAPLFSFSLDYLANILLDNMSVTEFPPLLSEDDLQKYKVPLKWRDRCALYFALYQTCLIRQSANSSVDCGLDKHSWEECENLDLIRRKKELQQVKEAQKQ